jgi:hypothetical protein
VQGVFSEEVTIPFLREMIYVKASHPRQPEQRTVTKEVIELQPGDVLIGEAGGQSLVEEIEDSSSLPGLRRVFTEHGHLYIDPEAEVRVALD